MTELAHPATQMSYIRLLGPADVQMAAQLADQDHVANVFIRHRITASGLDSRWLGAEMWGWFEDGKLVSLLHVGSNIAPAMATDRALNAFAERLLVRRTKPASLVGPSSMVLPLWQQLKDAWGPARSERFAQPLLAISGDSEFPLDNRVKPVTIDQLDIYYPACVAMFTEELGFHPETDKSGGYRARIEQLINQGWAWAIIENDTVLFKAEVGATGPRACQIQGVWVEPSMRNKGLGTAAMAAVVRQVRRRVAPTVSLYVNDHNLAARRVYEQVGFQQVDTFSSVLL